MEIKIIILIFISAIFMSGCASASNDPEVYSNNPNNMPRLSISPTPSDSTLPLTCQVTDLKIYINEADGYCFAYPIRFTLGDQPSDKPDVRGPALDDGVEPIHATLTVEFAPATNETLQMQAKSFLKEFSAADQA